MRAFTLLEVLAAAAIMAMFYGVLSAKGVEGFVIEGDADRRLHASLVADRVLADLETAIAEGAAPPLGASELEEGGYHVEVEVRLPELPLDQLLPETDGRSTAPSLLAPPERGQLSPLRVVQVRVVWNDGLSEHAVHRITFFLDTEAVATTLAAAGLGGGGETGLLGPAGDGAGASGSGQTGGTASGGAASQGVRGDSNLRRGIVNNRERIWRIDPEALKGGP